MDINRYEDKVALIKEVCIRGAKNIGPGGGIHYWKPEKIFPFDNDLIDLSRLLERQRTFGIKRCGHILCGDTKQSCILIALVLRLFKPSVVYEIGRYHGWSTSQIACSLKDNYDETSEKAKFISIDPHIGAAGGDGWNQSQCGGLTEWETSKSNIARAGVESYVTMAKAFSQEYINEVEDEIEFIFIDGDHRYEAAKRDMAQYGNKMVSNGIAVLHDVWGEEFKGANYGPSRAYTEADPEKWEKLGIMWDVGVLRRK